MKRTRRQKNRSNLVRRTRKQRILNHPAVRQFSQDLWIRAAKQERSYKPRWRLMRAGGEVSASGYTFIYDERDNGSLLCLSKTHQQCFDITIDDTHKAIGIRIQFSPTCATKDLPEEGGALIMLQAIIKLLFNHPRFSTFELITINDMSSKMVISHKDNKSYKVPLMDMYYVCTGCTWYASLIPMFLMKQADDEIYNEDRCRIVKCINATDSDNPIKWGIFLDRLPMNVRNYITSIIDANVDETASAILNRVRESRTYSIIFYDYIAYMLKAYNASSLYGKEWAIPLRAGKIIAPPTSVCLNKRGWAIPSELVEIVSQEEYERIKAATQQHAIAEVPFNGNAFNQVFNTNIDPAKRIYNPTPGLETAENITFNENNISLSNLDALLMRTH